MKNPSASHWNQDAEPEPFGRVDLLVVRPDIPWSRFIMFGTLLGGWTVLSGIGLALAIRKDAMIILALSAGIVVFLLMGGLRLYLIARFSRLTLDGNGLNFVSALGLTRTFARGSLAQIARASLDVSVRSSFTLSYYVFVRTDGRSAFKLPAKWWPDAGIVGVAATLGTPLTGNFFEIVDGPSFRRKFPRSIPWVVAHPRLAAVLIGFLSLPAAFVIISVVLILQGKA